MENLLVGQEEGEASSGEKWQVWDLKPMDYFFPEPRARYRWRKARL